MRFSMAMLEGTAIASAIAAGLLAVSVSHVAAQDIENCFRCADDVLNEEHKLENADPPPEVLWTGSDPHSWQSDDCLGSSHNHEPGCGGSGGGGNFALVVEYLRRSSSLEETMLNRLLLVQPNDVQVNVRRRALQLFDCDNHVVAHIPLSRGDIAALRRMGVEAGSKLRVSPAITGPRAAGSLHE